MDSLDARSTRALRATSNFHGTAVAARCARHDRTRPMKLPSLTMLREIENAAARFARVAGDHITAAPRDTIRVKLKSPRAGLADDSAPVSNVDRDVERNLRDAIAERFPSHAVLGEESESTEGNESPYVWVIDPIDGTTNYLNGLPLYGCSIGVLYRH